LNIERKKEEEKQPILQTEHWMFIHSQ